MNSAFNNLYTLEEIALHNNLTEKDITYIKTCITMDKINNIKERFPILSKFIPFCDYYKRKNGKKTEVFLAMSAEIYDNYCITGYLPNINNYDMESDINKLEYWQYDPPMVFNIKPYEDWEFANEILEKDGYDVQDGDIWRMFLAGNARMNYYTKSNITLEKRIKLAIMEYMLRRKHYFELDEFKENEILHIKYGGKNEQK